MENIKSTEQPNDSLRVIVRDIGVSVKGLVQSEAELVKAEFKDTADNLGKLAVQAGVFGGLLILSVLPFLAFLVIGLGGWLDGNYWLSSLIVSVFCAIVGGALTYRAYQKMKSHDFSLPHSRDALEAEAATVSRKVSQISDATRRAV